MPNHIWLEIAERVIDVEYKNEKIADLCRNYTVCGKEPDIKVIYDEQKCADENRKSGHGMLSAEFACIYRQIAEALPRYSCAVAHGAVVEYNGRGYMFIAKSGIGKTTHTGLWCKYFKGTRIINGDKPVISVKNGNVFAYGTPWAGKEGLQENARTPLGGICLIKRATDNRIRRLESDEALNAVIKQIYMPENSESLTLTIKIIDDIINNVPFYELSCNVSFEAAVCSFTALTGEKI